MRENGVVTGINYSTVDIYDVTTNSWSTAQLSEPRSFIGAAVAGNKVFFAGGDINTDISLGGVPFPSNRVDIYDLSTNTWSIAQLSEPRAAVSAVAINNKVYFAGGVANGYACGATKKIDIYDAASGTWSVSVLKESRDYPGGIAAAEKIFWLGGANESSGCKASCTVEIKDLNTQNTSIAYLSGPKTFPWAQNLIMKDNKILFFGSDTSSNTASIDKFDIYDVVTTTWTIGVLPQAVRGANVIAVNNTVYVLGTVGLSSQLWKLEF
jgi:hypothetical protein